MKIHTNSDGSTIQVPDDAYIESGAFIGSGAVIESRAFIGSGAVISREIKVKKSDRILSIAGFPNPVTIINNHVCVGCSELMSFEELLNHTETYAKSRGWSCQQHRTLRKIINVCRG